MEGYEEYRSASFEEGQARLMAALERSARHLGLYLESGRVIPHPSQPDQLIFVADFAIGDLAWRPRVQNPEAAEADKAFRELRINAETAEVEEIIKREEDGGCPPPSTEPT